MVVATPVRTRQCGAPADPPPTGSPACCGSTRRWPPAARALQHDGLEQLAVALQRNGVLKGATHHIGSTAGYRLQCTGVAGRFGNLDVQAFGAEVPQLAGNGQRQMVDSRLAMHGHRDAAALGRTWARSTGTPTLAAAPHATAAAKRLRFNMIKRPPW